MVVFTSVLTLLSLCILLPPLNLSLFALNVAAPELSPWLACLNLLMVLAAWRFCRPVLPVAVAAFLVTCWPILQLHRVVIRSAEGGVERVQDVGSSTGILMDCFRGRVGGRVQPKDLAMNILYYPAVGSGGLHPALIDIYGGSWAHGSPAQSYEFDSYMSRRGFAVFAIDYRHAPAFRFPAQLQDVEAAITYVSEQAAKYDVDRDRLILCGRSAGAELALLAAYQPGGVPVQAVVSYYGPTDLTWGYYNRPSPDPLDVRAVLKTYLGGPPAQFPKAYREASPVNYIQPGLPATLLLEGGNDHIVKAVFAWELYERLLKSGNRAQLVVIPWSEHGFDFVFPGLGNQIALRILEKFLASTV